MKRQKYFWYSIYLNFISLLMCILCIVFSSFIHRFQFVSIILTLVVILELCVNVVNYRNINKKKN